MKKRTCLIIAILLTMWLIPFLTCGSAAAQDLMIYPAASLTSDEQVPFSPEIGDTLTGLINNPNDIGMVMYSKPSFASDIIMTVMNGTPVTVISEPKEAEGYRWIQVQTKERYEGWVFATGVTDPDGNLVVPIITNEYKTNYGTSSNILGSIANNYSGNSGISDNGNLGYSSSNNTGYSEPVSTGGNMVWIYETGKKYHSHQGCSGTHDWQVTLEYAESIGRTPCKKCY